MPRKKSDPKKVPQKKNIGSKRKTISPLETAISQGGVDGCITSSACSATNEYNCVDSTDSESINKNKRFHSSGPEFFTFDSSSSYTNMNFQQAPQTPYPAHMMQSPPGYVTQFAPTQPNAPIPPWASAIMEDIKSIKTSVAKISEVEKTVNQINLKFADLDLKVSDIDKRVTEVEKSCTFLDAELDTKSREVTKAKSDVCELEKSCKEFESKIKNMNSEVQALNDRMTDSESRSMRNNLIFYGLKENETEDCEKEAKAIITTKLGIDASSIVFDRAHRMGGSSARKPRPIVVRFHYYKEREEVRAKAYDMNDALKREGLRIGIQRPWKVRETRKSLFNVMRVEREKGHTVKLVGDKLYVNGSLYDPSH